MESIPTTIKKDLNTLLNHLEISQLYSHQREAIDKIFNGENIVITTGVSSGKSLCYQIPILDNYIENPQSRSLLLFPTKALTQDQNGSLQKMAENLTNIVGLKKKLQSNIYDGDTPAGQRTGIRHLSQCIMTNPDMLHLGILPHHPNWNDFFRNLKYVIIDEIHIYRGIFGSHFANVIRRLKRIARKYGSNPQFILTSATVSNVKQFVNRLIEEPLSVIDEDGSPSGQCHFYLYNPPFINEELGIRQSSMRDVQDISLSFEKNGLQSLVFTQSRRSVELLLKNLQQIITDKNAVQGYRSGYLAGERRKIEEGLRDGKIRIVISTNALELGIDIGGLDSVIINGYPGSIASTKQEAGRAGRKGKDSIVVMVASSNLLDQYILKHPEYIFDNSPEAALINPDNPFILLNHIQCAVFEESFAKHESFGSVPGEEVLEYLELLKKHNKLHASKEKYFWISEEYPASSISLRTAGISQFILKSEDQVIGIVDEDSAYWFVHPEAVYLHNGESYLVREFDLEAQVVSLDKYDPGYYTIPERESEFELMELFKEDDLVKYLRKYGEIKVANQTVSFKKLRWNKNDIVGFGDVDLPKTTIVTHGAWISLPEVLIQDLEKKDLWNNHSNDYGRDWKNIRSQVRSRDGFQCTNCQVKEDKRAHDVHHKIPFKAFNDINKANELSNLVTLCPSCHNKAERQVKIQSGLSGLSYILGNIAPLYLMCDRSDIRVYFDPKMNIGDMLPTIIFYDSVPGGIGLSEKLYGLIPTLFIKSVEIISSCSCLDGCPACTGPAAENGEGAKQLVLGILNEMKSSG